MKEVVPLNNLLRLVLGYPDSNQERQDQNLQCYHYTIAQYSCICGCKSSWFLSNVQVFP